MICPDANSGFSMLLDRWMIVITGSSRGRLCQGDVDGPPTSERHNYVRHSSGHTKEHLLHTIEASRDVEETFLSSGRCQFFTDL